MDAKMLQSWMKCKNATNEREKFDDEEKIDRRS